MSIQTRIPLFL